MSPDKFREAALKFPRASESAHMGHPDFRVDGRIFATLGYPEEGFGVVKLTPEEQQAFMREAPGIFAPCKGAWGRQGNTSIHLASGTSKIVRAALDAAWRNVGKVKKSKPSR